MNGDVVPATIIRERGQLTIPKKLRERVSWLSDGSIVAVLSSLDEEIKIMPYREVGKKGKTDWEEVWGRIRVSRSFEGKRGNLSGFIAKDRALH